LIQTLSDLPKPQRVDHGLSCLCFFLFIDQHRIAQLLFGKDSHAGSESEMMLLEVKGDFAFAGRTFL
jgi:hypothetical protein